MTGKQVNVNIVEIKVPELDAQLVAENVAAQLEKAGFLQACRRTGGFRSMKTSQGITGSLRRPARRALK